ncbi:glycine--tRNA ligase subunit beta [Metabacillus arenae]|uniref:Glycine--tRNA ligase beta subunit n=1 Tax=Metabacillus arenae TaxID=2771434 RepID=A0A926S2L2_9BACI|nr:glycine--tRNA ligase subunit beta [Metabacillus arenae]MBD1382114.1 glycine--tRNA ligase subunit beta [Metabacillus arenae]
MNNRDLLLEIGLEEMPARYITDSMNQLGERVQTWLKEQNLSFQDIKLYSTPRRLAIVVSNLAEKQPDIEEEAKGPTKKIALDQDGNWTKAAIGFTKGQGASLEDIYFKELNGIEYVHVQKYIKGQKTKDLLVELQKIVANLTFPKNMRWGSFDMRFVRPIQWLIALYGEEVISFSITNVQTGTKTLGHRFLGNEQVISSPKAYEQELFSHFVIADPIKRKEAIRNQLKHLEEEQNWVIPIDEDLLEEVNNLVEYPTVLFGMFEKEFLSIPEEVLITSMKEHQRYFPVKDNNGKLIPYFVTVRNGDHKNLENVARGNEKVLRARLSDAAFFYKEDQKLKLEDNLQKLDKIVFHEELGTLGEKVKRITSISEHLSKKLNLDPQAKQDVLRAASISKFDLVTHMVYEFPELQGFMGEKYAQILGENEAVAKAVNEHYMPRHAEDSVPESNVGAIVAIADKLDTIAAFFSIGLIPTGSQDPYALRRQASGIVQILLVKKWSIPLQELFEMALSQLHVEDKDHVVKELSNFFVMRLKFVLQAQGIRYDIIDAVLDSTEKEVNSLVQRANVLENGVQAADFKESAESLSRVLNIAKKGEKQSVRQELFENEYEHKLYDKAIGVEKDFQLHMSSGHYQNAFLVLSSLKNEINEYFDHTMVMSENELVKENRLAQMVMLADLIKSFANINTIILK